MTIIQMHRFYQQLGITYQKVEEFFKFEVFYQYRFMLFAIISPPNPNPIEPTTYYLDTTYTHTHHTRSNFFGKRNVKEKDRKINFLMYFTMDKKMGTRFFCMKIKRNILFDFFLIWLDCNGYLFNIVLIITTNIIAKEVSPSIISLILFKIKNDFSLHPKNSDLTQFFVTKNIVLGDGFYIFITVYTYHAIFSSV